MDVRVIDGDVALTSSGETFYIRAAEEIAQRVRIAASVKKGAFLYDRDLGTDYDALQDVSLSAGRLDMLIREACAGIADAQVSVIRLDAQRHSVVIQIRHGSDTVTTEVDFDGNL